MYTAMLSEEFVVRECLHTVLRINMIFCGLGQINKRNTERTVHLNQVRTDKFIFENEFNPVQTF